jgi:hypothetical protein
VLPEALTTELRGLLEDMRLFLHKQVPMELIISLAQLGPKIELYDYEMSKRLLVLSLALFPPLEGEPPAPEAMDVFIDFTTQDIIHKLGGPCPVPPPLRPPTSPTTPTS